MVLSVAVTGGSGRLGGRITAHLVQAGHDVRVLDQAAPPSSLGVDFVKVDISDRSDVRRALRGCDAVVHLAGLHGAHLAAGVNRVLFWRANAAATGVVLRASESTDVRRFVLASSTSVFGPGSPPGEPARVLDESVPVAPDDVYDLTKVAAERAVRFSRRQGRLETVCLRFGRFDFDSIESYHLRKLSTGVDLEDAAEAVSLALTRGNIPSEVYCVASDLPLSHDDRRALGTDLRAVLSVHLPGLERELKRRGWELPDRVGKSVDTSRIRSELGYSPQRDVAKWVADLAATGSTSGTSSLNRRHAPAMVLDSLVADRLEELPEVVHEDHRAARRMGH